ncbi:hypothetical protein DRZ77_02520, partial [Candidatus Woesearchaeota archaeon]
QDEPLEERLKRIKKSSIDASADELAKLYQETVNLADELRRKLLGKKEDVHYVKYSSMIPEGWVKTGEELIVVTKEEAFKRLKSKGIDIEDEDEVLDEIEDAFQTVLTEKAVASAITTGADLVYEVNSSCVPSYANPVKLTGLVKFYRRPLEK